MLQALQLEAKKRPRQGNKLARASLPPSTSPEPSSAAAFVFEAAEASSQLLYMHDDLQGINFLIDTGAAVSLYPHQSAKPVGPRRL